MRGLALTCAFGLFCQQHSRTRRAVHAGSAWRARGTSRVGGTAGLCVRPVQSAQPQTRACSRRLSTLPVVAIYLHSTHAHACRVQVQRKHGRTFEKGPSIMPNQSGLYAAAGACSSTATCRAARPRFRLASANSARCCAGKQRGSAHLSLAGAREDGAFWQLDLALDIGGRLCGLGLAVADRRAVRSGQHARHWAREGSVVLAGSSVCMRAPRSLTQNHCSRSHGVLTTHRKPRKPHPHPGTNWRT